MLALGLGLGLTMTPAPVGGGAPAPASAITLLQVMGPTALDATGDYGDATARVGVNGSGWVAKATMPYLALQTFDPTKVLFKVQDPGEGGATTVTRYIRGTVPLRRQWNAANQLQASNDGLTYTVHFALDDDIYANTTFVDVQAEEGYYGGAQAGSVANVVNNSTLAYEKPMAGWLNVPYERATGATIRAELVVVHRRGRAGRMAARVEIRAKDSQGTPNYSAVQTVTATSLSTFQTQGNPVEVFAADVPTSALTQGDTCYFTAKVYPWLGDASAVLDLETDGVSWPTASPQTLMPFCCDKTGAYGGAHVAVKAGASGGTVQATYALALTTPFPTIAAAMAALPAWNNTNKGHNDHSGATVWLMEDSPGAGATHALSSAFNSVAVGKALTNVKVDPAATGAVKISLTTANACDKVRFFVNIDHVSGTGFDGTSTLNYKAVILEGATLNPTGSATVPLNYRIGLFYMRNVTITGTPTSSQVPGGAVSTTRSQVPLQLGTIDLGATSRTNTHVPFVVAGCRFHRLVVGDLNYVTITNWDSNDGQIVVINEFRNQQAACNAGTGNGPTVTRGIGWAGNVFERAGAASNPAVQIGADGQTKSVANLVFVHNTVAGGADQITRANLLYTDDDEAVGLSKKGVARFNIFSFYNVKTDQFASTPNVTGRVGNWSFRHTVGHAGNVVINGDSNNNTAAGNGATNWLGERWPADSKPGAASVGFTDNKTGTAGAGSGTYSLTGASNDAYGRVPADMAMLSFDMAGAARLNNGAGAAGAYERTV